MVLIGLLVGGLLIGQNSGGIGIDWRGDEADIALWLLDWEFPGDTSQFNGIGNNNYRIEDDGGAWRFRRRIYRRSVYFLEDMGTTGTLVYANVENAQERQNWLLLKQKI